MNRQELVKRIAARSRNNLSRALIDSIIVASLEEIVECVREGHKVTLAGFGTFTRVDREERMSRNPATGAQVLVPPRRKPKFIAGKDFRASLTESLQEELGLTYAGDYDDEDEEDEEEEEE